jgi:hypothetical protein
VKTHGRSVQFMHLDALVDWIAKNHLLFRRDIVCFEISVRPSALPSNPPLTHYAIPRSGIA